MFLGLCSDLIKNPMNIELQILMILDTWGSSGLSARQNLSWAFGVALRFGLPGGQTRCQTLWEWLRDEHPYMAFWVFHHRTSTE